MSVADATLERYPTADLLKLLANILTHIAQSNDRNPPVSIAARVQSSSALTLTSAAKTVLVPCSPTSPTSPYSTTGSASCSSTTCTPMPLTFHARNVPTISLESYLLRILKYCPTSNFVFLSLLVYFDRMAALSLASYGHGSANGSPTGMGSRKTFRVDSYNIHRLVIAGITVASKFFSDVFYTNSRYAKVGGLPLPELNQLELQFLLLNDFRLVISPQQMHLYTQHLIRFSLEHPPPSMVLDLSVLAASLGVGVGFGLNPMLAPPDFPDSSRSQTRHPPHVLLQPVNPRSLAKNKRKRATLTTAHTNTQLMPSSLSPPASPSLRPSCSPSPSPSNSSSSSLSSSPAASPRPPRMMTNGHLAQSHSLSTSRLDQTGKVRHPRQPSPLDEEGPEANRSDDSDEEDSDDEDQEESETLTSTSTDDDSEPTIRGPRTVVGWDDGSP